MPDLLLHDLDRAVVGCLERLAKLRGSTVETAGKRVLETYAEGKASLGLLLADRIRASFDDGVLGNSADSIREDRSR